MYFICYDFWGETAWFYILTDFNKWESRGFGVCETLFSLLWAQATKDNLLGTEETDLQENSLATASDSKRATKGDRKNQLLFS